MVVKPFCDEQARALVNLEQRFQVWMEAYHQRKTTAKVRRDTSRAALDETGRLCRALRVPMLASDAGAILREADRRRLLGSHLLVVGTSAMPAYTMEASGFLPDPTRPMISTWH